MNSLYSSQVLERAVSLLGCFSANESELGLTELATRSGLHKSTAYRILDVLRGNRLVEFNPSTRRYHLGLRLFELGALAVSRLNLTTIAQPELEWLVEQSGETAHLCVLDGVDVVYLVKVQSARALSMPSSVGRRNPAHCAGVGKAILAFLQQDRLHAILKEMRFAPVTPMTLISRDKLLKDLKETRRRGYAIDRGEMHEELRCVGVPVFDHSGTVVAGISIAGPWFRMTDSAIPKLAEHTLAAANRISRQLGYKEMRAEPPAQRSAAPRRRVASIRSSTSAPASRRVRASR